MEKTGLQIEGDIYRWFKEESLLNTYAIGGIYRGGMRPLDSRKEDIVVMFTYGTSAQVQTGIVTINVFVPDVAFNMGNMVANGARCETFEAYAAEDVERLKKAGMDYRFSLSEAIHTNHDDEIHQSFVVIKLQYQLLNI